jgi:hypothetical protein
VQDNSEFESNLPVALLKVRQRKEPVGQQEKGKP